MHISDQEKLVQMCGTHDFSQRLLQLHEQAVAVWHKVSSGPLPDMILMMIVIQAEALTVPAPVKSIWDDVDRYTPVIVSQNGETPYEAEFLQRRHGNRVGQVEIRLFQSDEHTKTVLERFVKLKLQPKHPDWPQRFWELKKGDMVLWNRADPETGDAVSEECRFQGIEPGGQVHIKAGSKNSRNEYVEADSIQVLEPVEVE